MGQLSESTIRQWVLEMYYYHTAVRTPDLQAADGALVFGRLCPYLGTTIQSLQLQELIGYAMITGGTGKDSGYLAEVHVPEAVWIKAHGVALGIPPEFMHTETMAPDGEGNCRLGLQAIDKVRPRLAFQSLILVATPVQLRRLKTQFETLLAAGRPNVPNFRSIRVQAVTTTRPFYPERRSDQEAAAREILNLAYWPQQTARSGHVKLLAQPDLEDQMVERAQLVLAALDAA